VRAAALHMTVTSVTTCLSFPLFNYVLLVEASCSLHFSRKLLLSHSLLLVRFSSCPLVLLFVVELSLSRKT